MNKEMKEYIKECDCPEIQELWKPKMGDFYFNRAYTAKIDIMGSDYIDEEAELKTIKENTKENKRCQTFLPSLSWLIEKMGDSFDRLGKSMFVFPNEYWCVRIDKIMRPAVDGSTPELACIRALKEILKEALEKLIMLKTGSFLDVDEKFKEKGER